jgi:hypothetical protein
MVNHNPDGSIAVGAPKPATPPHAPATLDDLLVALAEQNRILGGLANDLSHLREKTDTITARGPIAALLGIRKNAG